MHKRIMWWGVVRRRINASFVGDLWVICAAGAVFSVLLAAPVRGQTILDNITSWFSGKKADEPIADALPYKVTIRIDHGDSDVRSAIEDGSNLVTLQDSA